MTKAEKPIKEVKQEKKSCNDKKCPFHGNLSLRGRVFRGTVIKKFSKRVVIEFERTVYVKKYQRFANSKTKIHARLPDCIEDTINVGDYIEVKECRPLSKIISFSVLKKIRGKVEKNKPESEEKK